MLAYRADGAFVGKHDLLRNCEAKTSAARFCVSSIVIPIEFLEYPFDVLR